jgi:FdhD protein
LCGRTQIDDLCAELPPYSGHAKFTRRELGLAAERLREHQVNFQHTGGAHAAALVDSAGQYLGTAEDVGRHNAVDKLMGSRVLAGEAPPAKDLALIVSGRASFEIAQKAAAAGAALLLSVSAPSSLSVELCARFNLSLLAFARGGRLNVYTGGDRLS